jgi:oligoribonuclease NrnB/cAMP/cGMP phosphodiesterase (DHH superfamily)
MKPLILFHAGCADGHGAALCAWFQFKDNADYQPVNYGEPIPQAAFESRDLYILDFSYDANTTLALAACAGRSVTVRDHHKTAEQELKKITHGTGMPMNLDIEFDMSKSGCRMAWEYFFPGQELPQLLAFVEDRDLWAWKLPESRQMNAGIRSYPMEFERWKHWLFDWPQVAPELVNDGAAILRYQQTVVDTAVKQAVEVDIDGHKVLMTNATTLVSEIGEALAKNRPFGTTFFIRGDGKKIWSLRSREGGIDVSEVAKRHGGGGHKAAAGFETDGGWLP